MFSKQKMLQKVFTYKIFDQMYKGITKKMFVFSSQLVALIGKVNF